MKQKKRTDFPPPLHLSASSASLARLPCFPHPDPACWHDPRAYRPLRPVIAAQHPPLSPSQPGRQFRPTRRPRHFPLPCGPCLPWPSYLPQPTPRASLFPSCQPSCSSWPTQPQRCASPLTHNRVAFPSRTRAT
jgi:hypothetical protein